MKHFGKTVKEIRELGNVTQDALALRSGLSRSQIQKNEKMAVPEMSLGTYAATAKGLGLTLEELNERWGAASDWRPAEKDRGGYVVLRPAIGQLIQQAADAEGVDVEEWARRAVNLMATRHARAATHGPRGDRKAASRHVPGEKKKT